MPSRIKYSSVARDAFNLQLKEISQDVKIEIWNYHSKVHED
jgi:hypothetical protein